MANIKVADSVILSKANTPLDARCRVEVEADILNIELPFVGLLVYVISTGEFYIVTAVKERIIGAMTVADAAVAEYKLLSTGSGGLSEKEKEALLDELENRLLAGEWGTE